ncbi:hypothetical protein FF38_13421, partial [Lucilia cuprina]
MAMESYKYEDLDLQYNFLDSDIFSKVIDDLCIKNLPGYFPKFLTKNNHELNFPSAESILQSLQSQELEIAVTPLGNADSPVETYFAKPYLTTKKLDWVLTEFQNPNREQHYYFQTQDDNLELLTEMGCKVPRELKSTLSTAVLGDQIASNLWIGTSGTTSRLHSDNFDNIYVQLSGTKQILTIIILLIERNTSGDVVNSLVTELSKSGLNSGRRKEDKEERTDSLNPDVHVSVTLIDQVTRDSGNVLNNGVETLVNVVLLDKVTNDSQVNANV